MASEAVEFPRFSFGSTVSDIFGIIGRNFLLLSGLALLLYGVPSALFSIFFMNNIMSLVGDPTIGNAANPFDFLGMIGTGFILATIGSIIISIFTQGAMIWVSLKDLNGEKSTFGEAMGAGVRFFLPILGITLIIYILMGVIVALPFLLAFNIGAIGTAVLLFLFVILPLVFFGMVVLFWSVPAAVGEGIGPIAALGRSVFLSAGHRWKLFAMLLIFGFAALIVSSAISGVTMPFMMAGDINPDAPFDGLMPVMAIQSLLSSLTLVLGYPAIAATYHNLRVSKEGLRQEQVADIFE